MRENKEREGKTVRFSIRLPREMHKWLKWRMEERRKEGRYKSINIDIQEIIEEYMGRYR